MQQSTQAAGEPLRVNDIAVLRADGKVYRYRGDPAEAILGVAVGAAAPGDVPRLLDDLDAVYAALMH